MQQQTTRQVKKVAATVGRYLLILFFLYYYIGITAFVHTHQIAEYTIVTHSHPFFPGAHHSHSEAEYETVGFLNMLIAEAPLMMAVFFALSFIGIILQTYHYPAPRKEFHHPSYRAPPFALS